MPQCVRVCVCLKQTINTGVVAHSVIMRFMMRLHHTLVHWFCVGCMRIPCCCCCSPVQGRMAGTLPEPKPIITSGSVPCQANASWNHFPQSQRLCQGFKSAGAHQALRLASRSRRNVLPTCQIHTNGLPPSSRNSFAEKFSPPSFRTLRH